MIGGGGAPRGGVSPDDCASVADVSEIISNADEFTESLAATAEATVDEEIQEDIEETDDRPLNLTASLAAAADIEEVFDTAESPRPPGAAPPEPSPASPAELSPPHHHHHDLPAAPLPHRSPDGAEALGAGGDASSSQPTLDESREMARRDYVTQCQKKYSGLLFGVVLGQGSYGCVCLGVTQPSGGATATEGFAARAGGKCTPDHRMYAVKQLVLSGGAHDQEREVEAIWHEVEVTRNLRHRNIVEVLGAYREGGVMSIVMRFYPGGNLAQLVEKIGRLNLDVAQHYSVEMCKGVSYLHSLNVIHRDLKGANMLLDASGTLRIADFGSCREVGGVARGVRIDSLRGTPHWMAPEVIKQTGHGAAADVWSIGCTVVEMLTGKPPFSEFKSPHATMYAIANSTSPLPLPAEASRSCRRFLRSCLDRDASMRPASSDLLTSEWLASPAVPSSVAQPPHSGGVVGNNNMTAVQHYIRRLAQSYRQIGQDVVEQHSKQNSLSLSERFCVAPEFGDPQLFPGAGGGASGVGEGQQHRQAEQPHAALMRHHSIRSNASTVSYSSSMDNDEVAQAQFGGVLRCASFSAPGGGGGGGGGPLGKTIDNVEVAAPCVSGGAHRPSASDHRYAALDAEINGGCDADAFPYVASSSAAAAAACPAPAAPSAASSTAAAAGGVKSAAGGGAAHKRRILPAPLRDCPVHVPLHPMQRKKGATPQQQRNGDGSVRTASAGLSSAAKKQFSFDIHNRLSRSGSGRKAGSGSGGGSGGGGGGPCSRGGKSGIRGPSPRRGRADGPAGAASGSPSSQQAAMVMPSAHHGHHSHHAHHHQGGGGGSPPLVRVIRTQSQRATLAVLD